MKISLNKGSITATAETMEDVQTLLSLGKVATRNSYKGKHRKECPICHKNFKGLGIHMFKIHRQHPPIDGINPL